MLNKAFKFKLLPNKEQQQFFNQNIGNARFVYNQILNEKQQDYQDKLAVQAIANMYNATFEWEHIITTTMKKLKEKFDWLNESESTSLQQSVRDLDSAYKNHFRKLKNKQKSSIKFKSKKNPKESFRIQSVTGVVIDHNKIKLPKIGWVKFKKSKDIEGKIRNITISKNILNKYYISINAEIDKDVFLPKLNKNIGIDLGLKEFAVTSDNEFINNPKYLRKSELKLKKEQRKLSKRKKGGMNKFKQRKKVFKIHEKIKNQRSDFLHKLSTKIINENQVICLEDLNVKGMIKNKNLSKSISDVSWSEFVRQLEYKASWYGRDIIKIDRFFPSSKMCSICGEIQDMPLNKRMYSCKCGNNIDRDLNSSLNILNEGLRIQTAGTVGLA